MLVEAASSFILNAVGLIMETIDGKHGSGERYQRERNPDRMTLSVSVLYSSMLDSSRDRWRPRWSIFKS